MTSTRRPARSQALVATVAVSAVAAGWTLLILGTAALRFAIAVPRARLAMETAGAMAAALTAALASLRYSLFGGTTFLFVAVAFLTSGLNQLVFGIIVDPAAFDPRQAVYLWTASRLMTGGLVVVGALPRFRAPARPAHSVRSFVLASALATGALAVVESVLWWQRDQLPDLASTPADAEGLVGALSGLTLVSTVLAGGGAVMFGAAALALVRSGEPSLAWLAPPFALAAFAHVHYMLAPTVFTSLVSTGDILGLAYAVLLLVVLLQDVRAGLVAERVRADASEAAFEAERRRASQLEMLDRRRAELFSVLSHELLHPVAAVRSLTAALLKRWADLSEATRREMLAQIESESIRLRDLAEEVTTDLSRKSEFASDPSPIAVRELLRHALAVGVAGVRVEADSAQDALVLADTARIVQVLRNLIVNAQRHGVPPIAVSATAVAGMVQVSVHDEGAGIAADVRDAVFHRTVRGPASGGSGLGLYVCRRILEEHGGRIWVDDWSGRGCTLSFTLPLAEGTT